MFDRQFNPAAAILGWLWPGLGHISIGHRKRGGLIMFGILFLFLGGVLIGGLDCVDRQRDFLWFIAQSLCGPIAFGIDLLNQHFIKTLDQDSPAYLRTIGLNKPNEMGTLFAALAGLMNLVAILDALQSAPHAQPPQPPINDRRRTPTLRVATPGSESPGATGDVA